MNANPAASRKPSTIIGLAIVAAAVAAISVAVAVLVLDDDGSSPGSGGGAEAPAELTAVFEALPVFAGAQIDVPPTFTGGPDAFSTYWATGTPETIVAFYVDELSGAGWSVVDEPSSFSNDTTGKETTGWAASLQNDEHSVTVSATESEKDPARGNAYVRLGVEPR